MVNLEKNIGKGSVLVFTPHPDDEVFGCGGAIIRHLQHGDAVKVVIVTDGGFPVHESQTKPDYTEIRKLESLAAAKILGYSMLEFLDYPDGFLAANEKLIHHLSHIIEQFQPQSVYLPANTEIHPDHLALNAAGIKAVIRYKPEVNVYFYEIGQPLKPSLFLDISDIQPQLEQAMDCFKSQLEAQDYKKHITALHAYRTYTLGKDVKFAEAYQLVNSKTLKPGDVRWTQNYQRLQQPVTEKTTDEDIPLISVIVRTMNRPELPDALESIASQTYPNLEVIVVDARGEMPLNLGERCGTFPLRVISENKPLNRPEAANAGLDALKGEYFCFLDEDDLFLPGHIPTLHQTLLTGKVSVAYSVVKGFDVDSGNEMWFGAPYDFDKLLRENYIPNLALLFHSDLIRKGCRFDPDFEIYEDWDFLIQAAQLGDFLFVETLGGIYRNYKHSSIHTNMVKVFQFRKKMYLKWISLISDEKFNTLIPPNFDEINQELITEKKKNQDQVDTLNTQLELLRSEYNLLKEEIIQIRKSLILRIEKKLICFYHWAPYYNPLEMLKRIVANSRILKAIKKSGLFDEAFYLKNNPDVNKSGTDPLNHYLKFGGFEGRDPSDKFESAYYLEQNPDVKEANLNPLLHYLMHGKNENRGIKPEISDPIACYKEHFLKQKQADLIEFIQSSDQIDLIYPNPQISVILVLFNKAELTLACLRSLRDYADVPLEIIILDNNSTDPTSQLLQKVKVTSVICNSENRHFLEACNQALEYVTTPHILFLNNDAEISENAISSALKTLNENKDCGGVGAKLILLNGTLQEAGNIIWRDGSCQSYGRGDSPDLPEYNFKRIVDYCSGAFLLTRTELFKMHGGFDAQFAPAYYEETDYCLWLQENGYYIMYNPSIKVYHFEFGSSEKSLAIQMQEKNKEKFRIKHANTLKHHFEPAAENLSKARFSASAQFKGHVLYIDDRVPHLTLGSGNPRSNFIVNTISNLGYQVTLYPNTMPQKEDWVSSYKDLDSTIEIAFDQGFQEFGKFIQKNLDYYDIIWISRPHNLEFLYDDIKKYCRQSFIIYDAEAIFAERAFQKQKLTDPNLDPNDFNKLIEKEINLCSIADHIVAVSERDSREFKKHNIKNVSVLGHALKISNGSKSFEDREGLLFVGNLDDDDSPNVDSILWFVNDILPIIKKDIPNIVLHVVGSNKAGSLQNLQVDNVIFHGMLGNISWFYDNLRVFIAPTRYAAGVPFKIHEAASYGLPVVATEILAKQLGWENNILLLTSDIKPDCFCAAVIRLYTDPKLWNDIRKNSLLEIETNHKNSSIEKTITNILSKENIKSAHVEKHWSNLNCQSHYCSDVYWLANAMVAGYYNRHATSGNESQHWINYVVEKYFTKRNNAEIMLSVGCGDGELERHISSLNVFDRIEAVDLSHERIKKATELALENNFQNIDYFIRNVEKDGLIGKKYDAIFYNSSLHHFNNIDNLILETAKLLKPDGVLIINEYVGPNRLMYSEKEKEIIQSVFDKIPKKYRTSLAKENYGEVLNSVSFFDPREVEMTDPSEAVNSEAILPTINKYFQIIENNTIGGTLLHVVLQNIAGHFHEEDKESMAVLNFLFETEQSLIQKGEITNHFALIVAKSKNN